MKVCFIVPHLKIAGGIRVVLTYARELSRKHQITILVVENSRWQRWFKNTLPFKVDWFGLLPGVKIIFVKISDITLSLNRLKPEVVVADSWPMAETLNSVSGPFKKIHLIQHDERLYHGEPEVVAKTYTLPIKKIVVASWLQELLAREFNQASDLLLNSVDREIFKPDFSTKPNDGLIRVLILDHPYKWKGTEEGVNLVQSLKLKYPHLRLIGFGSRHKDPKYSYDEYYFSPQQKDLAKIYTRADIYLCPSWDEGFGLPSLEAMACGTAVVTYDNGGSRDFAKDGETALVAARQDQVELKKKLEQLINDQELRQKLAQSGLALVKSWPTWSEQAFKLEKILKNAITL